MSPQHCVRGRSTRLLVATFVALVSSACGGGGGGDGDANDVTFAFVGPYQFLELERQIGAMGIRSSTGEVTVDGAGAFTLGRNVGTSEGVSFETIGVGPPSPYTLGADRSLVWPVDLVGRVSPDGAFAAATRRGTGSDPAWFVLMRRALASAISEYAGAWVLVELSRPFGAGGIARVAVSDVTLDAGGALSYGNYQYNEERQIDPGLLILQELRLALDPDGWLRFDAVVGGSAQYRGAGSADRNLILMSSVNAYSRRAAALILVRQGQASQVSALSGAFEVAGFENVVNTYASLWGTASLDGSGNGSWTRNANTDGALSGVPNVNVTYGVLGSGEASFTDPTLSTWRGAVGPNGFWAVFGGGLTTGSDPRLFVLIR